ncbi:MAG: hypothetical protein PHH37_03460 [Paludibacter sp.]|nr:hypothetical protein [Paludibacter sp.]
MKKLLLSLTLICWSFFLTQATNYFATPTGTEGTGVNWENAVSYSNAIALATQANDRVYLSSGTYTVTAKVIMKVPVSIIGGYNMGDDVSSLAPDPLKYPTFTSNTSPSTTAKNFTFFSLDFSSNPELDNNTNTVSFEGINFQKSYNSSTNQAAILTTVSNKFKSNIQLKNCSFSECVSMSSGVFFQNGNSGITSLENSFTFTIDNCVFDRCEGMNSGTGNNVTGVFYLQSPYITTNITNSTFSNNKATYTSAVGRFKGANNNITISNCKFNDNVVTTATNTDYPSGIFGQIGGTATINISDSKFYNNSSPNCAILLTSGNTTTTINNSFFIQNTTTPYYRTYGTPGWLTYNLKAICAKSDGDVVNMTNSIVSNNIYRALSNDEFVATGAPEGTNPEVAGNEWRDIRVVDSIGNIENSIANGVYISGVSGGITNWDTSMHSSTYNDYLSANNCAELISGSKTVSQILAGITTVNSPSSSTAKTFRLGGKLQGLHVGDKVIVYDYTGHLLSSFSAQNTTVELPSNKFLIVKIITTTGEQITLK